MADNKVQWVVERAIFFNQDALFSSFFYQIFVKKQVMVWDGR